MVEINNLVIIGVSRAGKTTLANELGQLSGVNVVDMDKLLLQAWGRDGSIKDCHLALGNSEFRKLEASVYQGCDFKKPSIISVGGGALLDYNLAKVIKSWGILGWLFIPKMEIFTRWQAKPLIGVESNDWDDMYINRAHSCAMWADFILDANPQIALAQCININRVRYGK